MGMRQRLGVAACLLGDPDLLILDEPMNGLDPAGMHQMRAMIRSLVDEGRTVMLSSHLLDEVERTCDAVAIVDRGRVIRQGPIGELVRTAGTRTVRLDCSDPAAAGRLLEQSGIATGVAPGELELTVTLPSGASRETVAEVNRRLVEGGDLRVRPPGGSRHPGGLVLVGDQPPGRAAMTEDTSAAPAGPAMPTAVMAGGTRPDRAAVPGRYRSWVPSWGLDHHQAP